MAIFSQVWTYLLLALGFGFVVFFHELGHFLAAKYSDVMVEQFAVGFGPAILAWRKGMGFRLGSTTPEYEKLKAAEKEGINKADVGAISETEYRLNWIPLGGYVKMLGQDDLKPDAAANDPRAYNNKPIRSRMLIVSAGVIMNVILAAIGFIIVFLIGFKVPPAVVGGVLSGSPAMRATRDDGTRVPLQTGDRILTYDGKKQYDFTKIMLDVALTQEGQTVPIRVQHPDGKTETLKVTPVKPPGDPKAFLALGIAQPTELRGIEPNRDDKIDDLADRLEKDALAVKPGDAITAINGEPVGIEQTWKLHDALAHSDGGPVSLTVRGADGKTRTESVFPHFDYPFGYPFNDEDLNVAGLVPRARIASLVEKSPARGKIKPGDVVTRVVIGSDPQSDPSGHYLFEHLNLAGQQGTKVQFTVLSPGDDDKPRELEPLVPSLDVGAGRKGLGIGLGYDEQHAVVGDVIKDSPAAAAGIPRQSVIITVNDAPVKNWFQVQQAIAAAAPGKPVSITADVPNAGRKTFTLNLTADQAQTVAMMGVGSELTLHERVEPRKTTNPLVAAGWGLIETRDLILQFYLTLERMIGPSASVSYKNMMGPVGIFASGAKFADKGTDWLIWFLSMISANLAVVNFLPIPIVDGGLFTFLILEKIQGRPLSANTQKIIQFVGLALILGVFLLVTYQDIARMLGRA